jgi:hypothetical protein
MARKVANELLRERSRAGFQVDLKWMGACLAARQQTSGSRYVLFYHCPLTEAGLAFQGESRKNPVFL